MAPSTKTQPNAQQSSVLIESHQAPGGASVNRKKQKKRQKQAARRAAAAQDAYSPDEEGPLDENDLGPDYDSVEKFEEARQYYSEAHSQHGQLRVPGVNAYNTAGPQAATEQYDYSDRENDYAPQQDMNGTTGSKKKRNKKKKGRPALNDAAFLRDTIGEYNTRLYDHPPPPPPPPPISSDALRTVQRSVNKDPIWNNSSQEERARIKEFWLSLGENERKSLVKIERDAVLKKMKEQQKHSCSCTVCGRRRTAIEEELEVLYDAYYEELEQYANQGQHTSPNGTPMLPRATPAAKKYMDSMRHRQPHKGRITELADDEEEEDELDELPLDDEEFSDEDYDDRLDYSGDETDDMPPGNNASDFFTFGNSLTVKAGGILTVADDLLKNDGQKFIDMMEQLAERRMQREELSAYPYNAYHPNDPPPHAHPPHDHSPLDDEEYDDEDDDYEEDDDEDYEEEDEMDQMTEEQRMEEGRRMFQIFAARMFEQRVLTAYKEKVARERQEKLIQELEAENLADTQRDAKKQRDAEKKKAKKAAQKQAKAEEKAKKDADKAAEEAAKRDEEERKKEEARRKREELRKKKEDEKKALEAERQRKEAEKRDRLEAERRQREEAERKRAEDKRKRDEAKRKEREDKEAADRALEEKKALADAERRERQEQERARPNPVDNSRQDESQQPTATALQSRSPSLQQPVQAANAKRPSIPAAVVALPPGLKSRNSNLGLASPQTKVATPVIPKAPTPVRTTKEQPSRVSQNSTPLSPETSSQSKQSTPPRTSAQQSSQTSSIASRASNPQPNTSYTGHLPPGHGIAPPPGMSYYAQHQSQVGGFGSVPGMGMNGYGGGHGPHSQMMHVPRNQHLSMIPPSGQVQRGFGGQTMPGPPPGMGLPHNGPHQRMYPPEGAPGFPSHATPVSPGIGHSSFAVPPGTQPIGRHSRQQSTSYESQRREAQAPPPMTSQPISRPAPIKRPTSAKPVDDSGSTNADLEDVDKHLGSSALLDDTDEPLPSSAIDIRRHSAAPGSQPQTAAPGFASPFEDSRNPFPFGGPASSWRPMPGSTYPAPGMGSPTPGWGASAPSTGPGWSSNMIGNSFNVPLRPAPNRHIQVRILACKACQRLSDQHPRSGGFFDLKDVVSAMNELKSQLDQPIDVKDVSLILDSEPNDHNGGGTFAVSQRMGQTLVKWEQTVGKAPAQPVGERTRGFSGHARVGEIGQGMALGGLGGSGSRGGF